MKTCTKCKKAMPLSRFGPSTQTQDRLKFRCRACLAADQIDYSNRNAEKVNAARAEWRKANPELMASYKTAWVERNREQARASWSKNTLRRRMDGLQAEWARKNAGRVSQSKARHKVKRKSAEEAATPRWADADVIRLYYIYAESLGMQVDHIVPIVSDAVCGLHCEQNLQLLTRSENASKNNRWWPDMP